MASAALLSACSSLPHNNESTNNPDLRTVKENYPGNEYKGGKFSGPFRTIKSGSSSLWRYFTWKLNPANPRGTKETKSDLPVVQYNPSLHKDSSHIAWLGHATVLINLNGINILVDPILTSPRLFHGKRLGNVPITAEALSADILLVTHAHRDHLDEKTVRALKAQPILAYVPLKMGSLLRQWRSDLAVIEAGWYQKYPMKNGLEITLLPALHWSRRSLFDTNSTLWGSYLISNGNTTIFFAGDSGYAEHFKEIGELFNEIDYAILPIGSYEPAHIHKNSHMTPEQALDAFKDLNAKVMIPVHFGTYDLSDEPVDEPLARLKAEIIRRDIKSDSIRVLNIGEVLELE